MGNKVDKVGAAAVVGAGASADVQAFMSVQSTVLCMQEVLQHCTQSLCSHSQSRSPWQPDIFTRFVRVVR